MENYRISTESALRHSFSPLLQSSLKKQKQYLPGCTTWTLCSKRKHEAQRVRLNFPFSALQNPFATDRSGSNAALPGDVLPYILCNCSRQQCIHAVQVLIGPFWRHCRIEIWLCIHWAGAYNKRFNNNSFFLEFSLKQFSENWLSVSGMHASHVAQAQSVISTKWHVRHFLIATWCGANRTRTVATSTLTRINTSW